jgi:hypothetical protein
MFLELAPMFGCQDEDVLSMLVDEDGIARLSGVDPYTSPLALWPILFKVDNVILVDNHSMIMPKHWPFLLWKCLAGDDSSRLRITFTCQPTASKVHSDDVVAHVTNMHLFQTPSYRPLIGWLLDKDATPLKLPNGERVVHTKKSGFVSYKNKDMKWQTWFQEFQPLHKDMFELKVVAASNNIAIATDNADFKMVYRFSLEHDDFTMSNVPHTASSSIELSFPEKKSSKCYALALLDI